MSTSGEMVEATEDSRDIQGLEYRLLPNSLWRRSSASKPALRIGILLDSTHVRLWQAAVLTDIMRSNFAGIELLVFNTSVRAASMEREQRPGGWAQRLLLPQLRRQLF